MDSAEYWRLMDETSQAVGAFMLRTSRNRMVQGRAQEPLLRALLMRFAYSATGGTDWQQMVPLAGAVELLMCSLYLRNQVYDHKGGVICPPVSWLLRYPSVKRLERQAFNLVWQQLDPYWEAEFKQALVDTEAGLTYDRGVLNWSSLQQTSTLQQPFELWKMKCWCLHRCDLLDGVLIGTACQMAAACNHHGLNGTDQQLLQFGHLYGTALQIVNDIGDFVPPELMGSKASKRAHDAWADLRNGRITLPIIYGWYRGTDACRAAIERCRCRFSPAVARELTLLLLREGHIWAARDVATHHATLARRVLRQAFSKEQRRGLATACTLVFDNRYYHALRGLE